MFNETIESHLTCCEKKPLDVQIDDHVHTFEFSIEVVVFWISEKKTHKQTVDWDHINQQPIGDLPDNL